MMSELRREIIGLPPERRRLFELLLKKQEGRPESSRIPRRELTGPAPLSTSQRRIWLLHQLEPDNPTYNTPIAVRLIGRLAVSALEKALNAVAQRHEILRTTYRNAGTQVTQVIGDPAHVPLPVTDLSAFPEVQKWEVTRSTAVSEARRPFDLERGPVFRASLLRLDREDHLALVNIHHIACDGWSVGVLVREIGLSYQAVSAEADSAAPELPIQYADYAHWENEWLPRVIPKQISYWRGQLSGRLPNLELPVDFPRRPISRHRGSSITFELTEELTAALTQLSRKCGVTLYVTLLSAYGLLLYRYTGQEDLLIGTPTANRNRVELEPLIGCFINTLIIRCDLRGAPAFTELLQRIKRTALDAFNNQDVPFERVIDEVKPENSSSLQRLFSVWFVLHNMPMSRLDLPGLRLEEFRLERPSSHFDLALSMMESGGRLSGAFDYDADLFLPETIMDFMDRFIRVLKSITSNPSDRLIDVKTDRDQLPTIAETGGQEDDFIW